MTKKDYETIAAIIAQLDLDDQNRLTVAEGFADRLRTTNKNFDKRRFMDACGFEFRPAWAAYVPKNL